VKCVELIRAKVSEAREALIQEFDDERSHHQKMMSDYTRLQQRFENLQGDMQLMASPSSHIARDNSPFGTQQSESMIDNADSVISEMSDAGGDNVSLDGTQTVRQIAYFASTGRSLVTEFLFFKLSLNVIFFQSWILLSIMKVYLCIQTFCYNSPYTFPCGHLQGPGLTHRTVETVGH